MNRLALFDCDGTLVDSGANIAAAMTLAFDAHALPPPAPDAVRRIVGLSLIEAMAALHPQADGALHARLADTYKLRFAAMRGTPAFAHEPLYAGIAEALAALDADGWLLGVATGKSDRGLGFVLAEHGLTRRFVTLQTADRHPSKPHPAMIEAAMAEAGAVPATTVMIGDTSFDMAMAVNAGAHAVGVAWGYHTADELHAAGASCVVAHADDIAAALVDCVRRAAISAR